MTIDRRRFLRWTTASAFAGWAGCGLPVSLSESLAADPAQRFSSAADALEQATESGQVKAAALLVRQGDIQYVKTFGAATSPDSMFLLASISKPISIAALMTLYDDGEFRLDDRVQKFIPEFRGSQKEKVTIQHLLTHVSGLPDQLAENQELRQQHADMKKFIAGAIKTPLQFRPGSRYQYSSMGILLAAEIAQRISQQTFAQFVDQSVFQPLQMKHSVLGLGRFKLTDVLPCQVQQAAPESGAGDPSAKSWDWNSAYWRAFGAPWGGAHGSPADLTRFFAEFIDQRGTILKPETARLMIRNHNPKGFTSRGLGFDVGASVGSPGCSERTFGHTGSTGTLAWADPANDSLCIVLTTLPARAVTPHPRNIASQRVAAALKSSSGQ